MAMDEPLAYGTQPRLPRLSSERWREHLQVCALKVFGEQYLKAADHIHVSVEAGVSAALCLPTSKHVKRWSMPC